MNDTNNKKKGSCLIIVVIFFAVCIFVAIAANMAKTLSNSSGTSDTKHSGTAKESSNSKQNEDLYLEAQTAFEAGRLSYAKELILKAIKNSDNSEYQELLEEIEESIKQRKEVLHSSFDVTEDKVESITFIKPKDAIQTGLIFYPYIGIRDSRKYMLLRIGYQESVDKSMLVFTGIKIKTDEELNDISFKALDKMNNLDIFGTGITEVIDINVNKGIMKLLSINIPEASDILVRFESITNHKLDYELNEEQKQVIADILEYYQYLEETE